MPEGRRTRAVGVCEIKAVNPTGEILAECEGKRFMITKGGSMFQHVEAPTGLTAEGQETLHSMVDKLREANAPSAVLEDLRLSIAEEDSARAVYRERARTALRAGDNETVRLYEEVGGEEGHHFDEFTNRLRVASARGGLVGKKVRVTNPAPMTGLKVGETATVEGVSESGDAFALRADNGVHIPLVFRKEFEFV